ncbi:chloride channel protein [Telmatospirillum sp. J64-1]|uniref:chloride channel protein n=1 Tax=Telmatospirillum sp. J64-1 TaxID=2502183 RepID=UPI00115D85BC|nr:chloride channel protein [Telmatospirillum sp. J64-1]
MPARIVRRLRLWRREDHLRLALLALAVGLVVGVAVILFREAIALLEQVFFHSGAEDLAGSAALLPMWRLLLVPTLGGLAVGLLVHFTMPGGRPQGVAHVIEAGALHGGRMRLGTGLSMAVASALSIGVGASVGREGPAVHLGGAVSGWLSGRLGLNRRQARTLLGCGVAAAVAASFNAPIAGALFAHEVVVGHYALTAFGPIVIASVAATILARLWFGSQPEYLPPPMEVTSFLEFPAFVGLGLIAGLAAILFVRSVTAVEDGWERLRTPYWLRPMFGGLAVGSLALFFPQVLGVGHELTAQALSGGMAFWLLMALLVAKLLATAASLGSGFGGGVFSPALALGALLGGAYGVFATAIFPDLSSGPAAYAFVGMGAMAAAVLGAPISTILMVYELTGNYALSIAVMVACVLASVVMARLHGRSFFHLQLARRGLDLLRGQETRLLCSIPVGYVMKPCAPVAPDTALPELRERLRHVPYAELFVTTETGRLTGCITHADLPDQDGDAVADAIARPNPPVVAATDHLGQALNLMLSTGEEHLAVIDSHETRRLVGCIHESDVLIAYTRALVRQRAEDRGERHGHSPI